MKRARIVFCPVVTVLLAGAANSMQIADIQLYGSLAVIEPPTEKPVE